MKIRKTVINSLSVLILSIFILTVFSAPTINTTNVSDPSPESSTDYEYSPSINIYYDDDLTGFPGDGTVNSPYVITNYNFSSDPDYYGIYIQHTTKYILISNCYFNINKTDATGLFLNNVTNIAISSCVFTTDNSSTYSTGIKVWNCTNVDIGGNSITEIGYESGIWVMNNCSNINIHNNYIAHCWSAININSGAAEMHCYNLTIQENWIEFNRFSIDATRCHNLIISNNIINKAGTYDQVLIYYIDVRDSTDYLNFNNTIYYKFTWGDIQYTSQLKANESTIFCFTTTYDSKTYGRGPYTYQWDFGDGSVNGTSQIVSHEYAQVGNYTITATVTDADGEVYVRSEDIYINVACITSCPGDGTENESKISGYSIPLFILSGFLAIIFLRKRFRAN